MAAIIINALSSFSLRSDQTSSSESSALLSDFEDDAPRLGAGSESCTDTDSPPETPAKPTSGVNVAVADNFLSSPDGDHLIGSGGFWYLSGGTSGTPSPYERLLEEMDLGYEAEEEGRKRQKKTPRPKLVRAESTVLARRRERDAAYAAASARRNKSSSPDRRREVVLNTPSAEHPLNIAAVSGEFSSHDHPHCRSAIDSPLLSGSQCATPRPLETPRLRAASISRIHKEFGTALSKALAPLSDTPSSPLLYASVIPGSPSPLELPSSAAEVPEPPLSTPSALDSPRLGRALGRRRGSSVSRGSPLGALLDKARPDRIPVPPKLLGSPRLSSTKVMDESELSNVLVRPLSNASHQTAQEVLDRRRDSNGALPPTGYVPLPPSPPLVCKSPGTCHGGVTPYGSPVPSSPRQPYFNPYFPPCSPLIK